MFGLWTVNMHLKKIIYILTTMFIWDIIKVLYGFADIYFTTLLTAKQTLIKEHLINLYYRSMD